VTARLPISTSRAPKDLSSSARISSKPDRVVAVSGKTSALT